MIRNASDKLLSQQISTLPDVSDSLLDWFQPLVFTNVQKSIANFEAVETPVSYNVQGVIQPMGPQILKMKPEGQRAWKWFTLHAEPETPLNPDDVISFMGNQYRVMQKTDYSQYGYLEYHLVQDWTGVGP